MTSPVFRVGFAVSLVVATSLIGRARAWHVASAAPAGTFHYCTANPNSTGRPCAIDSTGSLSIANNTFTLLAKRCPPSTSGIFIYGREPAQYPMWGGYLCISPFAPGILRLSPGEHADSNGNVVRQVDLANLPAGGSIGPGTTWYFQYTYRDLAPARVNSSDGLGATFLP